MISIFVDNVMEGKVMQMSCTEIIREYKGMEGFETLHIIPIRDGQSILKAYLCPITCKTIEDYPECIELLTKWRKENPTVSNNSFLATSQRTKEWVTNIVLADDKKILFLICDIYGRMIGQIGLCNVNELAKSADIYAVIKGQKDVEKGIMEITLKTLLKWAKDELNIQNFFLTTQQDNFRAIHLYEKVGFCIIKNIPLKKIQLEDEIKWIETDQELSEKYDVQMEYRGEI